MPRGGISRRAIRAYDGRMRKPSLTADTFVTALAVLGVAASAAPLGCSKAENASVAPEPAAATAQAAPASGGAGAVAPADPAASAAAASGAAAAPAAAAPAPAPAPVAATAVDGGVKPAGAIGGSKKAQMACGAGTCSADMKKGTGN